MMHSHAHNLERFTYLVEQAPELQSQSDDDPPEYPPPPAVVVRVATAVPTVPAISTGPDGRSRATIQISTAIRIVVASARWKRLLIDLLLDVNLLLIVAVGLYLRIDPLVAISGIIDPLSLFLLLVTDPACSCYQFCQLKIAGVILPRLVYRVLALEPDMD
jgi:hypothetical protein